MINVVIRVFYSYFSALRGFPDWLNFCGGLFFGECRNNKIGAESRFVIWLIQDKLFFIKNKIWRIKWVNIRMKIRLNFGFFTVKKVWKYKNIFGPSFLVQAEIFVLRTKMCQTGPLYTTNENSYIIDTKQRNQLSWKRNKQI